MLCRYLPEELFTAAAEQAAEKGAAWKTSDLTLFIWAAASLGWAIPDEQLTRILGWAEARMGQLWPNEAANLVWGLAVLRRSDAQVFRCAPPCTMHARS